LESFKKGSYLFFYEFCKFADLGKRLKDFLLKKRDAGLIGTNLGRSAGFRPVSPAARGKATVNHPTGGARRSATEEAEAVRWDWGPSD
jgi:hypothetical protein